jgi:transcriptional regulator with XRE-family HTH domain
VRQELLRAIDRAGISHHELAQRAGTTRQYVSSVLSAPIPSLVTVEKLARALNKDVRVELVDRAGK